MGPDVTVVIPVHDGARFLAEALESVARQCLDLEVVVVDDGSTDRSGEIARDLGATVLRQEQRGHGPARNAGIAASRAPLIVFLDADDLIPPYGLAVQVEHLATHRETVGVIGMQEYVVLDGAPLPGWALVDGIGGVDAIRRPYATGVLARRLAFDLIGGFDPRFRHAADVDWLFRARDLGHRIDVIDDVVRVRRIHGANMSYDDKGMRLERFELLAARARRKRELR